MARQSHEVVTFKADAALVDAMKGVPNRSEFIRDAIVAALDGTCPLCRGTGILTPKQREHWNRFSEDHPVRECRECGSVHLTCSRRQLARGERSRT